MIHNNKHTLIDAEPRESNKHQHVSNDEDWGSDSDFDSDSDCESVFSDCSMLSSKNNNPNKTPTAEETLDTLVQMQKLNITKDPSVAMKKEFSILPESDVDFDILKWNFEERDPHTGEEIRFIEKPQDAIEQLLYTHKIPVTRHHRDELKALPLAAAQGIISTLSLFHSTVTSITDNHVDAAIEEVHAVISRRAARYFPEENLMGDCSSEISFSDDESVFDEADELKIQAEEAKHCYAMKPSSYTQDDMGLMRAEEFIDYCYDKSLNYNHIFKDLYQNPDLTEKQIKAQIEDKHREMRAWEQRRQFKEFQVFERVGRKFYQILQRTMEEYGYPLV